MSPLDDLTQPDRDCFRAIAEYWDLTPEALVAMLDSVLVDPPAKTSDVLMFLDACERTPRFSACETCGRLNLQFDDCGYFARWSDRWVTTGVSRGELDSLGRQYSSFCRRCGVPRTCER